MSSLTNQLDEEASRILHFRSNLGAMARVSGSVTIPCSVSAAWPLPSTCGCPPSVWISLDGLEASVTQISELQRQTEVGRSDLIRCNKVLGMDSPVGVVLPMVIQLSNVQSIGTCRAVFRRVAFSVRRTQNSQTIYLEKA